MMERTEDGGVWINQRDHDGVWLAGTVAPATVVAESIRVGSRENFGSG